MNKLIRLAWVPVALCLGACDVQVRDTTPAQYQANNDIGMYEVSATAQPGALVTPGSLVMFAIGGNQKVPLSVSSDGNEWRGLYSVRCASSFPLQILAVWRMQGLTTRETLLPAQPRQIRLTEPPLTPEAGFDTAKPPTVPAAHRAGHGKARKGKAASSGVWAGTLNYRFATLPVTDITAAHIEPASAAPADVAAAQAISVATPLPLQAPCGEPVELRLTSREQRSHGTLVIDTDNPGMPHWHTAVEFSPK
jgi:hypothetical protein